MYKYYDFQCPDKHINEYFLDPQGLTAKVLCKDCGEVSRRIPTAPHLSVRMGIDSSSSQATRWARMHVDEAKRENAKIDPNPSS